MPGACTCVHAYAPTRCVRALLLLLHLLILILLLILLLLLCAPTRRVRAVWKAGSCVTAVPARVYSTFRGASTKVYSTQRWCPPRCSSAGAPSSTLLHPAVCYTNAGLVSTGPLPPGKTFAIYMNYLSMYTPTSIPYTSPRAVCRPRPK